MQIIPIVLPRWDLLAEETATCKWRALSVVLFFFTRSMTKRKFAYSHVLNTGAVEEEREEESVVTFQFTVSNLLHIPVSTASCQLCVCAQAYQHQFVRLSYRWYIVVSSLWLVEHHLGSLTTHIGPICPWSSGYCEGYTKLLWGVHEVAVRGTPARRSWHSTWVTLRPASWAPPPGDVPGRDHLIYCTC